MALIDYSGGESRSVRRPYARDVVLSIGPR